jgi:hypothetical protein
VPTFCFSFSTTPLAPTQTQVCKTNMTDQPDTILPLLFADMAATGTVPAGGGAAAAAAGDKKP